VLVYTSSKLVVYMQGFCRIAKCWQLLLPCRGLYTATLACCTYLCLASVEALLGYVCTQHSLCAGMPCRKGPLGVLVSHVSGVMGSVAFLMHASLF
jgi:hypothetical protein